VVSQAVSDPAVVVGDSAARTIPAAQYYTTFAFRGLKSGSVSAIFAAPGYKADTMVITVDTAQLSFGSVPTTVGPNQSAQMYVAVPFTNDSAVIVSLSTSPPGVLGVPSSVTIPARAGSVYFNVTGLAAGTAHVSATAPIATSGTSSDIVVGQPKLQLSLPSNAVVAQKTTLTVYAEDSLGVFRNVASPLTVTLVSSDPTNTVFDSATIRIAAGNYYAQTGITFNQPGSYTITGTASGYVTGNVSSTASGALVQIQTGAPGSFAPQSVTISAGQYVTWRNVATIGHTSTEDTGPLWDTGAMSPGASYQRYFGTAGTFTYHCTIHPAMTGTVVVNP
jgi:plastocyanin